MFNQILMQMNRQTSLDHINTGIAIYAILCGAKEIWIMGDSLSIIQKSKPEGIQYLNQIEVVVPHPKLIQTKQEEYEKEQRKLRAQKDSKTHGANHQGKGSQCPIRSHKKTRKKGRNQ